MDNIIVFNAIPFVSLSLNHIKVFIKTIWILLDSFFVGIDSKALSKWHVVHGRVLCPLLLYVLIRTLLVY